MGRSATVDPRPLVRKIWCHFGAKYSPEYRFLDIQPTYKPFRIINRPILGHLHTVEVVGSNPAVPTNLFNNLAGFSLSWLCCILLQIVRIVFFVSSFFEH
jgi:hypothetical protein